MKALSEGIEAFNRGQYARAIELLTPIAKGGSAKAQCYLGTMYQSGLGVPVDGIQAVAWYKQAADQGIREERISGIAYNNLATIYSTGLPGVLRDKKLAAEFDRKAKELGFEMKNSE